VARALKALAPLPLESQLLAVPVRSQQMLTFRRVELVAAEAVSVAMGMWVAERKQAAAAVVAQVY
jgi:hypothetical protein